MCLPSRPLSPGEPGMPGRPSAPTLEIFGLLFNHVESIF